MNSPTSPSSRTLIRRVAAAAAVAVTALVGLVVFDGGAAHAAGGARLTAVTPARMLDTRQPSDPRYGFKPAGAEFAVQIAGRGGVPADVSAAVLNLTVTQPSGPGHITLWPCGTARPTTSNLNFMAGDTVANMAVATLDAQGRVCVYTYAPAHIVIDANGYLPAGADYTAISPRRLVDTRPGAPTVDGDGGGAGKRTTVTVQVTGRAKIPAGAAAAAVNLTVTQPDAAGHLTAHPCGAKLPVASNVNFLAGQVRANAAVVALDANGRFCVTVSTAAHVVVDVAGWFGADGISTVTPARLTDTRGGQTVDGRERDGGRLRAGEVRRVQVTGRGGVPESAPAAVLNVTAVTPGAAGHLTVFPCLTQPDASNVNYTAHSVVPNAVVAKLDSQGGTCVFSLADTDLVVDVAGFVGGSVAQPPIGTGGAPIKNLDVWAWCSDVFDDANLQLSFEATWKTAENSNGVEDVTMPAGWLVDTGGEFAPESIVVTSPFVEWKSNSPWVSPASTTITIKGRSYTIDHGPVACEFI